LFISKPLEILGMKNMESLQMKKVKPIPNEGMNLSEWISSSRRFVRFLQREILRIGGPQK